MSRSLRSEQGAAVIQLALTMVVMIGFAAMVMDMGVVWAARGQAQNAADAGALAGGVARAFDETADPPTQTGAAYFSAYNAATANKVIGAAPAATVAWDCPSWYTAAVQRCVHVEVFRDGTNGSAALPAFFSKIFPASTATQLMRTRATATARVADANHTECLKPWLIPDRFTDVDGDGVFTPGVDIYAAPGYTDADIGTSMILRPGNPKTAAAPSNFYGIGAAPPYEEEITGCILSASIGDTVRTLPGNRNGPTQQGVAALLANGPVVVVVGLFSPEAWATSARNTGEFDTVITNLMGFRIESVSNGGNIYGTIVRSPGDLEEGGGTPTPGAGFLKIISLIR